MSTEVKSESNTEWMQKLWRPAMGWMYMLICLLDMAIFPVLWSVLQAYMHMPITQWNPLTLQGAGLFHIAMGAVLGIAAFGRTQEKLAGTAANPTATSQTITNNMNGNVSGGFGSGQSSGFGNSGFNTTPTPGTAFTPAASTSFTPAASWGSTPTAAPVMGFGGKAAPVQPPQPEL